MAVFIVDDDQAIRQALAWLLRSRQVDSQNFASGEGFLAFLESSQFPAREASVLLLDVRMDGISGLQLFDILSERGLLERMPVLFLTGHAEVAMAVDAVKAGAFDFFEKPFSDNKLVDRVLQGLERSKDTLAASNSSHDLGKRLGELTEREREVMNLIMQGRLNKVIADELAISMRTVEVHRSRIFAKLKVRSAVEMVNLLNTQSG